MSQPLAERALCVIEGRLAGIAAWDGYATDAGLRVLRSIRTLDESDLPCVVLWDDGEDVEDASGNTASMKTTLRFSVEGHIPANQPDTGCRLGMLRADVKRALLRDRGAVADARGAIGVLTYTGSDSQSRNDGAASEAVALHFMLTYKEAYGDPSKAR